jgi:hypothetical protein
MLETRRTSLRTRKPSKIFIDSVHPDDVVDNHPSREYQSPDEENISIEDGIL